MLKCQYQFITISSKFLTLIWHFWNNKWVQQACTFFFSFWKFKGESANCIVLISSNSSYLVIFLNKIFFSFKKSFKSFCPNSWMMFVLVAKICKWFAKFCTKEPNSISSVGSCFHSKLNFYCEPEGKRKGLLSQQKNMHLLWKIPTWLKSIGKRTKSKILEKKLSKERKSTKVWQA